MSAFVTVTTVRLSVYHDQLCSFNDIKNYSLFRSALGHICCFAILVLVFVIVLGIASVQFIEWLIFTVCMCVYIKCTHVCVCDCELTLLIRYSHTCNLQEVVLEHGEKLLTSMHVCLS